MNADFFFHPSAVADACRNLAQTFPGDAEVVVLQVPGRNGQPVPLPMSSVEGNDIVALRLRRAGQPSKPVFMIIAEQHGNEWGGCEIAVNLASDLLHFKDVGVRYQRQVLQLGEPAPPHQDFIAADLQAILQGLELVIVPLVNPDGRLSQTRKNRRPFGASGIGVDLNRNYNFQFLLSDAPGGDVVSGDDVVGSSQYRGTAPFSEPETRVIRALVEAFAPSWFVDLHSGDRCVLHPRSVGPPHVAPLSAMELKRHHALARAYANAAGVVRAPQPPIMPGFDLGLSSGTSHDWVYDRGQQPGATSALALAVEWNDEPVAWPTMGDRVLEATAGLVAMCFAALPTGTE